MGSGGSVKILGGVIGLLAGSALAESYRGTELDLHAMLQPVSAENIFADPEWEIWCGSMVKGDDGKFHLFYSRWPRKLTHKAWVTHSEVAHAIADSPTGPYRHADVTLPARGKEYWDGLCTHNPTVIRARDGKFYLYYMGNTGDGVVDTDSKWQFENTPSELKSTIASKEQKQPLNWIHRNNQRIGVAVADSPTGPWKRFDKPVLDVSADPEAPDALMVSNPSVTERPEGGFLMVYKGVAKKNKPPFGGPVYHLVATSDSPIGPFVKRPKPIFGKEGVAFAAEDPFIWTSEGLYLAVVKDNHGYFTGKGYSLALFESKDGIEWRQARHVLVATPEVTWRDGRVQKLCALERPQLYIENGIPKVFFCAGSYNKERIGTFNIAFPLKVPEPRPPENLLRYTAPAANWNAALPVGNGRLGAMVFGRVEKELIQLNEESVWSGQRAYNPSQMRENLPKVRQLLFEGKYVEAETLANETMTTKPKDPRYGNYQPLGDLTLTFPGLKEGVTAYERTLDIQSALAKTVFKHGGATYTREVFSSAPDQVLVMRLTSDQAKKIAFTVELTRKREAQVRAEGAQLVLEGRCDTGGSRFHARLAISAEGGHVVAEGTTLRVEGADAATIYLAANTDYRKDDPAKKSLQQVTQAQALAYEVLRLRHVTEYQSFFNRVELDLGQSPNAALPTDVRLERVRKGEADPALAALHFQFGRYLLISSSRPGCLPANLQGIWNDSFTPAWFSDYTININAQMNYWPAEVCNLSECHEPFFDLLESLREPGRQVAKERYGTRGFVLSTRTTPWGATDLRASADLLYHDAAAWMSLHVWEHYLFTQDKVFLEKKAYPVMCEAASFYLDFLVPHPKTGLLVSGPGTSPENKFWTPEGKKASLCMGPTMSHQIITELFRACIKAGSILETSNADFLKEIQEKLNKLTPMKIASDGRLQEWSEELKEVEPGHRHISHLFGLYPGTQIQTLGTPKLADAARKVLDVRLAKGGGGTGWSRAWIINFYARLADGERAHEHLLALLSKSTLPNLFDYHPPFQIDGNFGAAAGVAEMLVQSHEGTLHLLPALPSAWPTGKVSGLRCRGGFVVDMGWKDCKLQYANIQSLSGEPLTVYHAGKSLTVALSKGATYQFIP